tara:strand:- start:2937 stop:5102 length:2166 start_codon:yes stop_codon:yes gene_type:complete
MSNIAVFGDISTNGIDGSSIWLQSICNVFASEGHNVFLILRDKPILSSITDGLDSTVSVINPWQQSYSEISNENAISPEELITLLTAIDQEKMLDHIIMRAPRFLEELHRYTIKEKSYDLINKVDAYFAKLNIFSDDYDLSVLSTIRFAINRLIVQTEQMRDYAEQLFPLLVGKVIVLNPMIPKTYDIDINKVIRKIECKSVIYAGKLDTNYLIEDYIDNAPLVGTLGFDVSLVGSKFNTVKSDKQFRNRVENKIENSDIEWIKVLNREQTIQKVSGSTFLISIRNKHFDSDNEISTKLLESIAAGTLPIINKNNVNIGIVGENYPLFANSFSELSSTIMNFPLTEDNYRRVLSNVQTRVDKYTFKNIYDRQLKKFYEKSVVTTSSSVFLEKKRVLIASHDNKFLNQVLLELKNNKQIEIRFDNWKTTSQHNQKISEQLLDWADIILCEWAVGPAVFYSQNKKEHQKLLVRLHRFEITTERPYEIRAENVDSFIVVSDYIKNFCIKNYHWHEDMITVMPQFADTHHFDRSKVSGYEYNLGLLGCIPSLKRLDRSLDILEELRKVDKRYVLYIKSKMPWEVPFIWNKEEERAYYSKQLNRIESSQLLRDAVVFDDYGNDVAVWFRKIGWILSTSDIEGCHTAVAEAMSSGSQAAVFDWPGAKDVYALNKIFTSSVAAARHINNHSEFSKGQIQSQREYCFNKFDISKTLSFYNNFIFNEKVI